MAFSLKKQDREGLLKIRDEIMDKVKLWENRSSGFFGEADEYTNSWRVQPRVNRLKRPTGLFNSKSGETHRSVETLANLWFSMLMSSNPPFDTVAEGLDQNGDILTSADLYTTEAVLRKQLQVLQFEKKLDRFLRSLALFGTGIIEEPFVSLPYGSGQKHFEGTDFQNRSLIQTGFDTSVFDIELSDFIFTVDYLTKWRLRDLASVSEELWDVNAVEAAIKQFENFKPSTADTNSKFLSQVFSRLRERKERAGYDETSFNVHELISYHGRLEVDNPILRQVWDESGMEGDIKFAHFSVSLLNEMAVVKVHPTQNRSWHSRFKTSAIKLFEMEPRGYGSGKIGRKHQRELDLTISRGNDIILFALYSMWKVGRFAGLKSNQLNIKPWQIIEMDDINQLEAIRPDINAVLQAINMQGLLKEDFRGVTGATSNLQAVASKATATEAALIQNEALRGGSVHARIISTLFREHLDTMHLNNLDHLDDPIWVAITGSNKPVRADKTNLPKNVGFNIKLTLDRDFRPERLSNILNALQMATNTGNVVPQALNVIEPLVEEYFRGLGIDPRLLRKPRPVLEQLTENMQRQQALGQSEQLPDRVAGEPQGDVPTSPLPQDFGVGGL